MCDRYGIAQCHGECAVVSICMIHVETVAFV